MCRVQKSFLDYLVDKGVIGNTAAQDSSLKLRQAETSSESDWINLTKLAPVAFANEVAAFYACRRIQRTELTSDRFAGAALSPRFLKEERLFPFEDAQGQLTLAIARPVDEEMIRAVEVALGRKVVIVVATADDLEAALTTTLETAAASFAQSSSEAGAATADDLDDLRDLARGAPVVRALDELLRLAVEQRATDLHIEPFSGTLQVRLRVDGLLKAVPAPPLSMAKGLLSRLKIMAALNITERRLPQDGRMRITVAGVEFDLRVATMPTQHGESAVIRLLRKGGGAAVLDQIGLLPRDEKSLRNSLAMPFGLIIVTGPTGSGKTTTLAASLAELNKPGRKILTIEDPVEYQISGVNQTQVHPAIGLTFASALRAFLRQDPDVIMVGEMRDAETAHMGVHAALTGHLVLTTLHTNTAAGAIARLIDMGIESFLLASSVKVIVGQRLVRILCADCKVPHRLTENDLAPDHRYESLGFCEGEPVYRPKGCELCGFSGFRGRRGLFEVLEVTPAIRNAIGPQTDSADIEKIARREGMTTMAEDGIAKCRQGLTTIDEVFRVTMSV